MDLNKLKGDKNNNETIAFRLPGELKTDLMGICDRHNLSVGKVMRELTTKFVKETRDLYDVNIECN